MNWKRFELKVFKKGSGGGGTGIVEYPGYMEDFHHDMLDGGGAGAMSVDVADIMDVAIGNSPFTGETAYDPDASITGMENAVTDLDTLVALLSAGTGLDALVSNVLSQDRLDDAVDEFSADLGNRLTAEVLPRFEAGMRNINAVVSSAFVIGRASIEEGQTREVGKFSAGIHLKAFGDDALRLIALKMEYQKALTGLDIETNRMKIVAKKEETDHNIKLSEADALWDLELFAYGYNTLSSIGGGISNPKLKEPSTTRSAIGGALTGMASGAMVGSAVPGIGTAVGAVAGGALGAAAALL